MYSIGKFQEELGKVSELKMAALAGTWRRLFYICLDEERQWDSLLNVQQGCLQQPYYLRLL